MALNPSCNSVRSGTRFPNLGDPPFTADRLDLAKKELQVAFPDAKIMLRKDHAVRLKQGSNAQRLASYGVVVPVDIDSAETETIETFWMSARWLGWSIRRAWYYWSLSTDISPVPQAIAKEFNERWCSQVRVEGYSGGRDVVRDVSSYDVDTVEGLAALAELLRQLPSCVDLPAPKP